MRLKKSMNMLSERLLAALLFVSLSVVLLGCEPPQEPPPQPRPALVKIVGAPADPTTMTLVGEVRPRYESNQAFRVAGKIVQRIVEIGTSVKRGQVLAKLDAADNHLNTAAALADTRAVEAEYALALTELKRQQQLFAKHFISAAALDAYQAKFKTAQARLAQVKAHATVADHQTRYTHLTADRDGVVTFIRAEPGQVVEAGEMIAQIADIHTVEVSVTVPESRIQEVHQQAPAKIRLWANRQQVYNGMVREIAPAADSVTRAFNVRVSVQNPDVALKFGMTAGVSFNAASTETGLLIPSAALTEREGNKIVWVIDSQQAAQPREVVTGAFTEAGVAVLQGLQAGEMIAIAGVHTLVKGQQVRPLLEKP